MHSQHVGQHLVLSVGHGKQHRGREVTASLGETEAKNTVDTIEVRAVAISDDTCAVVMAETSTSRTYRRER